VTLAAILLWAGALIFGVIGLLFLFAPVRWARLVEISVPTPMSRTDLRATYGGFDLAMGAFLAISAMRPEWHGPGLVAAGLALLGFALGRLVGFIVERRAERLMLLFFASEVIGGALCLWAYWNM
jgi:uncharacterized protein YjeT (DUF2065 family)